MGLGILEAKQAVVPGTIQLFDSHEQAHDMSHLKHTKDGKTILAPQPSDSPNDPLNWTPLQKDFTYALLMINTILSGVHATILSPVTVELATEFNVTITKIAQLSSDMLLMVACSAFLLAPIANVYGKRGIFIVEIAIEMAADAWACKAESYSSLLGARMLSGVGMAAYVTLPLAVIPDVYFVHQRNKRILTFLVGQASGAYLGTVIGGQIIAATSWRTAFMGLAISEGIMTIATFFLFEECQYNRPHVDPLANLSEDVILEKVHDLPHESKATTEELATEETAIETRHSYVKRLNFYSGRKSQNNIFLLFYRSVALIFHPTVMYATCFTLLYSWDAGVSFTIDAFMTLPPYNFSTAGVSNVFLAPWLGTIIAALVGEPALRLLTVWLTKKNNNVYEPEFRLFGAFPGVALGIMGCVGWGWGEQDTIHWVGLAFFDGIMAAGAALMNATGVGYIIDAHREYANETQVILFAVRVCHRLLCTLTISPSSASRWDTSLFLGG